MNPPPLPRRLVGIRFPSWTSYGPQVLAGIVAYMREHGLWKLLTENNSYGEMETISLDEEWLGDGLILFRATENELATHRRRGRAVVLTSTEGPDLGFPRVVPDNTAVGRIAADHLVGCAVPHFAFLARGETLYREQQFAPGMRRYPRERLAGFQGRLAEHDHEPIVHYLKGRPLWKPESWREIQTEIMAFLDRLPKPCGVFAVDDSLGAVVLRAADAMGLKVPEDLAVIGFGDDPNYCYSTFPALTSIAYPGRDIGHEAAELLARQMRGETVDGERVIVPVTQLVPRESTDTLAIPDPEIRKLVRHIRLRAPHDALRVAELTEHSKLSATTIKLRFTEHLGHGPKQEIQLTRLRHLRHLLRNTKLPVAEIARRMNFGSAHELGRFFQRETGIRPGDFRKEP